MRRQNAQVQALAKTLRIFRSFYIFSPVLILLILRIFFFLSIYFSVFNIYKETISIVDCEPSPNELAALLIGSINLTRIKFWGIGIFMSNITVITLNKFGKRARGCCIYVFLVYIHYIIWSSLSQTYTYKGWYKSMDYSWPVPLRNPRIFYSFHSFQTINYWGI